jgi:competence protein ComFC
MKLSWSFKSAFYYFIDILFPMKCVCCGRAISNRDNCVCGSCIDEIISVHSGCGICNGVLSDGICVICSNRKWYIKRNISLAEYSGVMKEIMHNYKFNSRKSVYKHISNLANNAIGLNEICFDIITSVPMNRTKMWKRGYNQSELIAKSISRNMKKRYLRLLKERFFARTQRELKYRERFLNILDRYKPVGNKMKGKKILLIDDIFTTGATINECARTLLQSGAQEVYSLTVSRANIRNLI